MSGVKFNSSARAVVLDPAPRLSPRCGKPMLRYEAANGPMLEEPTCARPEGHAGMCRSAAALERKYAADIARIATIRRVEGKRYGRPQIAREAA